MQGPEDRVLDIKQRLKKALEPTVLNIRDDSRHHADHLSAKAMGGGHFSVEIVSPVFLGKSLVQRHQMVYKALEGSVGREIHAIQITAKTPTEHQGN